jgi:hypothetical protein
MALEKLQITPLDQNNAKREAMRFSVLFNPTSYSITSSVTWTPQSSRNLNAPPLTYGGGASRTLTLDLFYDVTEPVDGRRIDDVRQETNKIVALARKDPQLDRPPTVAIEWGAAPLTGSDFPFFGVVSGLTQNFTLFKPDGRPVRANLNVTFTEFIDPEIDQRKLDPEFTTRIVRRYAERDRCRDVWRSRIVADDRARQPPRRSASAPDRAAAPDPEDHLRAANDAGKSWEGRGCGSAGERRAAVKRGSGAPSRGHG